MNQKPENTETVSEDRSLKKGAVCRVPQRRQDGYSNDQLVAVIHTGLRFKLIYKNCCRAYN